MTREEEIRQEQVRNVVEEQITYRDSMVKSLLKEAAVLGMTWADEHPKNPWITDGTPEIKGSISDAVVLLIDGMFYKVSRLERRKDGTEFWWGVHPEDGEEVDAWMPIPETPKGGEK